MSWLFSYFCFQFSSLQMGKLTPVTEVLVCVVFGNLRSIIDSGEDNYLKMVSSLKMELILFTGYTFYEAFT